MNGPSIDRPAPVRRGEEIDAARLGAWLGERLPELAGTLAVEQFPRGFSNLTYLLRLTRPDSGERELVLRRPPFGTEVATAHDMGREYRILSHLAPVWPQAPRPLVYCEEAEVLGAPFYVMERVEGVILRGALSPEATPGPDAMAGVAAAFVDTFSGLHAVDAEAAGLGDLGRPEGYVRRQVEGWTGRYRQAATDDIPEMDRVASWLAGHLPPESSAALIHNDFKYDNLVLDPADLSRVVAVLDWEMATLGDPLMDLGTSLGYWVEAADPPQLRALALSPTSLPGNPSRTELVERYETASGRRVENVVFYYAYGLFKIAVIVQQIYARYKLGHTRDPRFADLIEGVRVCAATAAQAIAKGRLERLFEG